MGRRRVVQRGRTSGAHWAGDEPQRYNPSPHPSGFRPSRNDEWGAGLAKGCREWRMRGWRSGQSRIGVQDMLS